MPKLAPENKCTGCTACMGVCPVQCIEMKKDENGFAYPKIVRASECINCGQCENVCPVLNTDVRYRELPAAYAALSKDETMRMDSSSGGIFTELAKEIIAQGGVVFGAAYDDMFNVEHVCVDTVENLSALRGAKYTESDLDNSFAEILHRLKQGQKVLFSGTPCQVAGLKAFVGDKYDSLYCVDFVCHGIPSPMAWEAYIKYRAKEDADGAYPAYINLRSKSTGWSKYQYSNVFEYGNGNKHSSTSSQSLFMKLFVGDYISRESCEECKFKWYNRVSDITLGDFWGIWDLAPEMDDNKGTSVILVQSEKGKSLWSDISNRIVYKEVSLEEASQQNPSMLFSSKSHPDRIVVLKKIREGKISECKSLFKQPEISLINRIKRKMKRLLNKQ